MNSAADRARGGRVVVIAVVVAACLASAPARAETNREQARAHFRQGLAHYNLGEFEAALEAFKASYRLQDDPALLFNVGQCEWKLGRLDAAVRSYRSYLRMRPEAENRAEVERRISELDSRARQAPASAPPAVPTLSPPKEAINPALTAVRVGPATGKSVSQNEQPAGRGWALWVLGGAVLLAGCAAVILTQPRGTSIPSTDLGAQRVFP